MAQTKIIQRLNSSDLGFEEELGRLLTYGGDAASAVEEAVCSIISDVRRKGDTALLEYTKRFDGVAFDSANDLAIDDDLLEEAPTLITQAQRAALEEAEVRIRAYAERQKLQSWRYEEADGTMLGQQITPLDRVGLYVPGGTAAYPSSVLMNAIPAHVAGVRELIMVTPTPNGEINKLVLAAAAVAGVDKVFRIGGAQAVAALAYGTDTIPKVDKIVGPGNIYVATAKRRVFGEVGIDMIAGPSEVLIIADGSANHKWLAMDLFAQAEHDSDAQSILLCPDDRYLDKVETEIKRMLPKMERVQIISDSLRGRGALIKVRDLDEAADLANRIAPEHLELAVSKPDQLLAGIRHAGAIFLGHYSAEVFGDYCAGPNHVLPTARTARFSSPLGVYDFQKRTSLIWCSAKGARKLSDTASVLARGEGLTAHARSAEYRRD